VEARGAGGVTNRRLPSREGTFVPGSTPAPEEPLGDMEDWSWPIFINGIGGSTLADAGSPILYVTVLTAVDGDFVLSDGNFPTSELAGRGTKPEVERRWVPAAVDT